MIILKNLKIMNRNLPLKTKNLCKNSLVSDTCYSLEDLKIIAKKFNESHQHKIKLSQKKQDLLDDLKNNIKHCDNEKCWMNSFFVVLKENPFESKQEDLTEKDMIDRLKELNIKYLGLNKSPQKKDNNSVILFLFNNHWTCLVIKNKKYYYYDPTGKSPSHEIHKLIMKNLFIEKYSISNIKDQKTKNNKCGHYVLKFIEKKFK